MSFLVWWCGVFFGREILTPTHNFGFGSKKKAERHNPERALYFFKKKLGCKEGCCFSWEKKK
jgi:hypothetical protein